MSMAGRRKPQRNYEPRFRPAKGALPPILPPELMPTTIGDPARLASSALEHIDAAFTILNGMAQGGDGEAHRALRMVADAAGDIKGVLVALRLDEHVELQAPKGKLD